MRCLLVKPILTFRLPTPLKCPSAVLPVTFGLNEEVRGECSTGRTAEVYDITSDTSRQCDRTHPRKHSIGCALGVVMPRDRMQRYDEVALPRAALRPYRDLARAVDSSSWHGGTEWAPHRKGEDIVAVGIPGDCICAYCKTRRIQVAAVTDAAFDDASCRC